MNHKDNEPRYVISIAARMVGVRTHTLRYYEKIGIIEPSRSKGNIRLYSEIDIVRLRQMKILIEELGVSLAGAEVILRMAQRLRESQAQIEKLESELKRLGDESF
jgi:MerR family transcriptional regulator/heat shock protein HspR